MGTKAGLGAHDVLLLYGSRSPPEGTYTPRDTNVMNLGKDQAPGMFSSSQNHCSQETGNHINPQAWFMVPNSPSPAEQFKERLFAKPLT